MKLFKHSIILSLILVQNNIWIEEARRKHLVLWPLEERNKQANIQQAQSRVTCPHYSKPNLHCSFSLSQRGDLYLADRKFLISISEVICTIDPTLLLKKDDLAWNNPLSARKRPLSPPSRYKSLPFCTAP